MAFYLSPLVAVNEIDLTTTIPAVATSIGVIVLRNTYKGPENKQVLVASEADLITMFGEPTEYSYTDILGASGFLKYGNKLYCTRVMPDDAKFASAKITNIATGGTGLMVTVAVTNGIVTSVSAPTGGTGYLAGEFATIQTGSADAIIQVTEVTSGVPSAVILISGGTGTYTNGSKATISNQVASAPLITGGTGLELSYADETGTASTVGAPVNTLADSFTAGTYNVTVDGSIAGTGLELAITIDATGAVTSTVVDGAASGTGFAVGEEATVLFSDLTGSGALTGSLVYTVATETGGVVNTVGAPVNTLGSFVAGTYTVNAVGAPTGTQMRLSIQLDATGAVTGTTILDGGKDFTIAPDPVCTVTIPAASLVGAGATSGTLAYTVTALTTPVVGVMTRTELNMLSGGVDYKVGQTYTMLGTSGDQDVTEGYITIDTVDAAGTVLTFSVTSPGSGYSPGTILLEPRSGYDWATGTLADLPSGDPDDFGNDVTVTSGDIWAIASSRGNWGEKVKIAFCDKATQEDLLYGVTSPVAGMPSEYFSTIDSRLETDKDFLVIVLAKEQRGNTYSLKETFNVTTDPTAKDFNGNYRIAESVINQQSNLIRVAMSVDLLDATFPATLVGTWFELEGAADGAMSDVAAMEDNIMKAYRLYENAEEIDVNLFLDSGKTETVKRDLIAVCEERKDCMAILDCPSNLVINNAGYESTDLRDWRNGTGRFTTTNLNENTSYAAVYGNWVEVYDKYNQKYRWIPASGVVGGVYAKTDDVADPWWAPAGLNRAVLTGVRRLAWNPKLGYRDILYSNGINPIVSFAGQGKVIWGQKTMLSKESAFNRVNVRRLFLVLEKAISTACKYFLFEPNDPATRSLMVNMIVPFLRDVQARRGIYDFRVVCDESNNTPERIDRNELWCNIFIKPTRTAEFIVLNFIATKTGASFEEAALAVG